MNWRPALWVLVAAAALLACNIAAAFAPVGAWHGTVTVSLCVLEAASLALWWMHLIRSSALLRLCAAIPCGLFLLLVGLVLADVGTRNLLAAPW